MMIRQGELQAMLGGESQSNGTLKMLRAYRLPNVAEWVLSTAEDVNRVVKDTVPFEGTCVHWVASHVGPHADSLRSHLRVRLLRETGRYQMSDSEMADLIH
tara:strand:+ start:1552 stop:1854 length:303 start_codon:yes stop_codon:yes gene_type:complete